MIESEKFLNSVVENIPDMIFVKRCTGSQVRAVQQGGEELLGTAGTNSAGKMILISSQKTRLIFSQRKIAMFFSMKQILDISEERIQTRLKGERILHTKKIPILDETGNPAYLMGISEEITDYKRTEEP